MIADPSRPAAGGDSIGSTPGPAIRHANSRTRSPDPADKVLGSDVAKAYLQRAGWNQGIRKPAGVEVDSVSGSSFPNWGAASESAASIRLLTSGGADGVEAIRGQARHTVLLLEDANSRLDDVREAVECEDYRVLTAERGLAALEMLAETPTDLVILPMRLPDMDGAEFCRRLRDDRRLGLIPVLMFSAIESVEQEVAGISSGADAFLVRPFHREVFRARLRSLMRHKRMVDRLEESETILMALAHAVELRDPNTAGHCERLAALAIAMGMTIGLPPASLRALHRGSYLHDIGKIGIPDSVLFKKGPLSEAEWETMRTHTVKGESLCRPMKCLTPVLPIIRSHHERWDGSGYPDGLAGQRIPLLARVLQLADIYDALTAARCYKAAMSPAEALRVMQEETARGWHDPELMRLFLRLRHDAVREAADRNAAQWQDLRVMHESLANLQSSILRF